MVPRVNLQTPCYRTCYQHIQYIGSFNIGIYKDMSILSTYTHIYRGFCTVFITDICAGMSMLTVLYVCICIFYRVLQEFTHVNCKLLWRCRPWLGSLWSDSEQSGLAQSFWHWIREFKRTSHLSAKLKRKISSSIQVNTVWCKLTL